MARKNKVINVKKNRSRSVNVRNNRSLNIRAISTEQKSDKGDRDTIRIVIRDAKAPVFARVLQGFMRVVCIAMLLAVAALGVPRLFGIYEFNVLTGSMTPTYPVGTLVFVQPKEPASIRVGEVVTVVANQQLELITHRVTANNYDDKTIVTKGDANNSEDAPSRYENVVGVVCFSVPEIGGTVEYFTNTDQGRIFGVGILAAILALTVLSETLCSVLAKEKASLANAKNLTGGSTEGNQDKNAKNESSNQNSNSSSNKKTKQKRSKKKS